MSHELIVESGGAGHYERQEVATKAKKARDDSDEVRISQLPPTPTLTHPHSNATHRHTQTHTETHRDRRTDGQTDRQTDRHACARIQAVRWCLFDSDPRPRAPDLGHISLH